MLVLVLVLVLVLLPLFMLLLLFLLLLGARVCFDVHLALLLEKLSLTAA